jgi:hypothetical protein
LAQNSQIFVTLNMEYLVALCGHRAAAEVRTETKKPKIKTKFFFVNKSRKIDQNVVGSN